MLNKNLLSKLKRYVKSHLEEIVFESHDLSEAFSPISKTTETNLLDDYIKNHRQPKFQQVLFDFIDEKNLTDVNVYKKAWMDRRHFSKIRSNPDYNIGKNSVIALALALELDLGDTKKLLHAAGFSLSHSNTSDLVIKFCIEHEMYNLYDVNGALDYMGLKTLSK